MTYQATFADPDCLAAQADRRIGDGEDPEGFVHRLYYPSDYEDGRAYSLSTSLTPQEYFNSRGLAESYRTLSEVAAGCWD